MPHSSDRAPRRVVLVGFMCSGKSAVARRLARTLGWRHVDLDEEITRREGRSIPRIFREAGEGYFREVEARIGQEVVSRDRVVVAPGGGWITTPGALDGLPPETLTVWLRVSAGKVLERAGSNRANRPLLDVPDPLAAIHERLAVREPLYARADLAIDTDFRTSDQVVREIERAVRPQPPLQ